MLTKSFWWTTQRMESSPQTAPHLSYVVRWGPWVFSAVMVGSLDTRRQEWNNSISSIMKNMRITSTTKTMRWLNPRSAVSVWYLSNFNLHHHWLASTKTSGIIQRKSTIETMSWGVSLRKMRKALSSISWKNQREMPILEQLMFTRVDMLRRRRTTGWVWESLLTVKKVMKSTREDNRLSQGESIHIPALHRLA